MQIKMRLDSRTADANGSMQFPLSTLPAGKRVRSIALDVAVSYTKLAADALSADLFSNWIANLRLANYVNIPGFALHRLVQRVFGRNVANGVDIPGSGTAGIARFQLYLPFRDPRQTGSDDGSMPCDLLRSESLMVTLAAGNVHGVGSLTVAANGFTVSASAEIVEETHIPQINQIGFFDPGGQTFELPAGVYKDAFVLKAATTGTFTEAEIANIYMEADGTVLLGNVTHGQMVQEFNTLAVRDTASELVIGAAREFPIAFIDQSGKGHITKQPAFEGRGRVQLQGTYATPRVVFWRSILKNQGMVEDLANAIGRPEGATEYEPQTATKQLPRSLQVSARMGRFTRKARLVSQTLAGKLRQSTSPNND